MMKIGVLLPLLLAATPALAQHAQPYAGQQGREVKSLSAEEAERALDALHATGRMDEAALAGAVRAAAVLEGEYRLSHLETHRRLRALLTDEQVARYNRLRGYGAGEGSRHHGRRH